MGRCAVNLKHSSHLCSHIGLLHFFLKKNDLLLFILCVCVLHEGVYAVSSEARREHLNPLEFQIKSSK